MLIYARSRCDKFQYSQAKDGNLARVADCASSALAPEVYRSSPVKLSQKAVITLVLLCDIKNIKLHLWCVL